MCSGPDEFKPTTQNIFAKAKMLFHTKQILPSHNLCRPPGFGSGVPGALSPGLEGMPG
jgi:hypothetical protein